MSRYIDADHLKETIREFNNQTKKACEDNLWCGDIICRVFGCNDRPVRSCYIQDYR